MRDTLPSDPETYAQAIGMPAIAMTDFPMIGCVVAQLRLINVTVPRPKPTEVAIKLKASSIHIDEIYAAQGTSLGRFFGPKQVSEAQPYIMGSSVAGTVVAVGENVTRFAPGDEIIVIPNEMGEIGSWATYRCVTEAFVFPNTVPRSGRRFNNGFVRGVGRDRARQYQTWRSLSRGWCIWRDWDYYGAIPPLNGRNRHRSLQRQEYRAGSQSRCRRGHRLHNRRFRRHRSKFL